MGLHPGATVVDFGAGKCSWLARILDAVPGSKGVGIEPAGLFADEAEATHAELIKSGRLSIERRTAAEYLSERASQRFDGAVCVGSSHAFGGYDGTLEALSRCIRPGGAAVVAEGYWKKPPSADYLKALGGTEDEMGTHASNIERAIQRGFAPRWCCTVTDDEWDEYEWGYSRGIETWIDTHPNDPDRDAMLQRSRTWRETFVRWGRDTLGFGVYVLGMPSRT